MKQRSPHLHWFQNASLPVLLIALSCLIAHADQPTPAAVSAFNQYIAQLEARLATQHSQAQKFIALADPSAQTDARLHRGEFIIENLSPANLTLPAAMLYHWRGTAFLPGVTAADFEKLMRAFPAYPRIYAPQVVSARVLSHNTDRYQVTMRVKQHHVLTVVMDTTYDIDFAHLDDRRGFSNSRSTRINEIENAGAKDERVLSPADQRGFLWRLNTYWTWQQKDGGLYIQIESVSLTRSIPTGLGWAIGPFVQSVPRDSLEFTLRATSHALKR